MWQSTVVCTLQKYYVIPILVKFFEHKKCRYILSQSVFVPENSKGAPCLPIFNLNMPSTYNIILNTHLLCAFSTIGILSGLNFRTY